MKKKIFRSVFLAAMVAMLTTSALIIAVLYRSFHVQTAAIMRGEAEYIAKAIAMVPDAKEYLNSLGAYETRLTLIAADGTVLFDTLADPANMENHLDRPEVEKALHVGGGESSRYSSTLSEKTLYYAQRLADGRVLRLANTQRSVLGLLYSMITAFVLILVGIGILSAVMAGRMSVRVLKPLNHLNLEQPLENQVYDELSPLLIRMEHQKRRIAHQVSALTEQRRAFAAVADNMREGMVLLDGESNVLMINKSASRLFGADESTCLGKNILALNRSESLQTLVEKAKKGGYAEEQLSWRERCYQLIANPVPGGNGEVAGAVILILDVTDKESAERLRREFSANVSHELKTPLTSIAGYAEIMENGLAKPEDMPAFAGRIHLESKRLIALVEDILKLSKLDEKSDALNKEQVSLLHEVEDAVLRLMPLAAEKGIALMAKGGAPDILGVTQVVNEMLYNLIDNSIKYTMAGGTVLVNLSATPKEAVVTVSDTGIGIPPEYHEKVFERFYRVDQSHNKKTGGTGLGLSIVKHGAVLHGARVKMDSAPDRGTTITIRFPLT